MQLIGRVFLLAVCIFSAYSLPNFVPDSHDDGIYQLILAQVRSALIDTRAMTPAETVCANQYNNRTQTINNQLTNQTNNCFENANRTVVQNNQNLNTTTAQIRQNMLDVQRQITNCTVLVDNASFLNCTTASFDYNLLRLDAANSKSYEVVAHLSANQSQVDVLRQGCVNSVVGGAKTNLTQAANEYNVCLNNAKLLRNAETLLLN